MVRDSSGFRMAATVSAAVLLLGGCGDDVSYRIVINGPSPVTTPQVTIVLSGHADLPEGSVRTGGTQSVPYVTCQPGPYSMAWTNGSNGASGTPVAAWTCSQDVMTWTSGPVPLAPGHNTITVTFTDRAGSARASVVAVRN